MYIPLVMSVLLCCVVFLRVHKQYLRKQTFLVFSGGASKHVYIWIIDVIKLT